MSPLILATWAALAAAALSPGPNLVAVAGRALGTGRAAALWVTTGLALGAFLWAIATSLGLGLLFDRFPTALTVLGFVGGGYLMWLGFKGIRSALTNTGGIITPNATDTGPISHILHGLLVTGTNPKVAVLWASMATFVAPAITNALSLFIFAA
ncbi:MAG: LysE family transporter, partial [Pseudomonadota bacterium]